ncbi:MAG: hypothetical protein OHK0017_12140 [Patescibacteria group bacterium]
MFENYSVEKVVQILQKRQRKVLFWLWLKIILQFAAVAIYAVFGILNLFTYQIVYDGFFYFWFFLTLFIYSLVELPSLITTSVISNKGILKPYRDQETVTKTQLNKYFKENHRKNIFVLIILVIVLVVVASMAISAGTIIGIWPIILIDTVASIISLYRSTPSKLIAYIDLSY